MRLAAPKVVTWVMGRGSSSSNIMFFMTDNIYRLYVTHGPLTWFIILN